MLRSKWKSLDAGIGTKHVFAIGDIHGHAGPLEEALAVIARTPKNGFLRHLVILGDTIDGGPDNLAVTRMIENAKELADVDEVSVLTGNHEILLHHALKDPKHQMLYWLMNGGTSVAKEIYSSGLPESMIEIAENLARSLPSYLTDLENKALSHITIDHVLFTHAGISPHLPLSDFLNQPFDMNVPGNMHWAWIRFPFLEWTGGWGSQTPLTIAHGHSPAVSHKMTETSEIEAALMLHNSHGRINLDAGASQDLAQIAMAEFLQGDYRIHIFQN